MLYDEMLAHLMRDELSTKHFYQMVAEKKPGLLQGLLDRIRAFGKGTGAVGEAVSERAAKAEQMFTDALSEVGYEVAAGKVVGVRDEEDKTEVDKSKKRRYNKNYQYTYTEGQYNSFGWVRANNILNPDQHFDFMSRFADIVKRGYGAEKSVYGEYMIPVSGLAEERFGIDNTIVFAEGTIEEPLITRVIKINLETETEIEIVREKIIIPKKYRNHLNRFIFPTTIFMKAP